MPRYLSCLLLTAWTVGCTSLTTSDVDAPHETGSDSKLEVSGFWIPVMSVSADEDRGETDNGIEFEADLESGTGFGARFGVGETHGLGLLYLTTHHDERDVDTSARTHAAYLEYLLRLIESKSDPIHAHVSVAAGVGGAAFDFDRALDDTGGAAGQLRVEAGVGSESVRLTLGAGGFLWGYPGETIGTGGFLTLGMLVRF